MKIRWEERDIWDGYYITGVTEKVLQYQDEDGTWMDAPTVRKDR